MGGGTWILLIFAGAGIAGYLVTLVTYLAFPGFLDHVEPALACVAALFFGGDLQIYPLDPNIAPHAQHYGPMFFVLPATLIGLTGDAILGSKLASAFGVAAGLAVMSWVAMRETRRWDIAVLLTGLLAWWLLRLGYVTYWARPDGQILLPAALAVWSVTLRSHRWSAILLGVCMGITAGVKINAFLALLPLAAMLWHRAGFANLVISGVTTVLITFAPFVLPQVSLQGYVHCLSFAAQHGISAEILLRLTWVLPVLLLPLAVVCAASYWVRRVELRHELRGHWAFWLVLLPCLSVEMVFASKSGSGSSQLIVLLPVLGYALLRLAMVLLHPEVQERGGGAQVGKGGSGGVERTQAHGGLRTVFILALMFYLGFIVEGVRRHQFFVPWALFRDATEWRARRLVRTELHEVLESFPPRAGPESSEWRVAMGFGSGSWSELKTSVRPDLIRLGHPYLVEAVFLMDVRADVEELNPAQVLDPAKVDAWLIPRGNTPFLGRNYYPDRELILPKSFVQRFITEWQLAGRSDSFDIWIPKSHGEVPE